jgi:hypothetical protein
MNRKKYMHDYHKRYYITHKKELDEYRKVHQDENKEYQKRYRAAHKKQIKINMRLYYLKNKAKIIRQHSQYQMNKRRVDLNFRILDNLRSRLHDALHGYSKSDKTLKLIGCNTEQLIKHLETQFKSGMSWSNYGKWHIDHIIPCSHFDLSKSKEQRKCFHYTNLQPLWAEENRQKLNKLQIKEE